MIPLEDFDYYLDGRLKERNAYSEIDVGTYCTVLDRFYYDPAGLLMKYKTATTYTESVDCPHEPNDWVVWRYRYNPMKERESKRMTAAPRMYRYGNVYPWAYYLLGSGNEQLVVYHAGQLSDVSLICESGSATNQHGDLAALFYPVEFNTFGLGSSPELSYRLDESGSWVKHFNICDHLGSVRRTLKDNGAGGFSSESNSDYAPWGDRISHTELRLCILISPIKKRPQDRIPRTHDF